MTIYSIVRIGSEYVVLADQQRVLKTASRRKAARLVTDAAELMDAQPVSPSPQTGAEPSTERDPSEIP
jgi:hypothetical protein